MIPEKASEAMPYTVGAEWSVRYRSSRLLKWNLDAGQVEMLTMKALEKEMATHSSIPAWRISWTEEPGGLQSMGSQESDTTWRLNHRQPPLWLKNANTQGQFLHRLSLNSTCVSTEGGPVGVLMSSHWN